ncbi:MAG: hypothetical protein PHD79_03635 [Aliarcobacter sp.]|nr:hypothetical protein [Aliarcobacter sp.]
MKKYLALITILISTLSANNWEKLNLEKDPFTGKNGIAFINNSKDNPQGKNVKLIVRCGIKDYPEIIVDWNTFLHTEKVKMLERVVSYDKKTEEIFDKSNANLERTGANLLDVKGNYYPVSKNFTSIFYPQFDELASNYKLSLKSKLYELVYKKTLVLKVAPYNNNPMNATFNLSGLKELIMPYKEQCQLPNEKENSEITNIMIENILKAY